MLKRFIDGIIFGGGFAISFVFIWYLASFLIYPMFAESYSVQYSNVETPGISENKNLTIVNSNEPETPFHELSLEQKIKTASFIALAEYEESLNGEQLPIIKEFLKENSNSEIYYKVGDEYKTYSNYSQTGNDTNSKLIIFFVGSPATMRYSTTYSGDRIHSLGGIPEKLLRDKCKKST
ncbi:MAG: hypothetical protein OQK46_02500 [Gammaproteobacteria bacterium]|nr:hypothetical protein [Gammaproteobacteria bacterium]